MIRGFKNIFQLYSITMSRPTVDAIASSKPQVSVQPLAFASGIIPSGSQPKTFAAQYCEAMDAKVQTLSGQAESALQFVDGALSTIGGDVVSLQGVTDQHEADIAAA